jgi:putative phage-type endonuclease
MNARKQWLRRRKELLTASDVAAVLGVASAFRNILDVYLDKTTDEFDDSDSRIMRHGRHNEPFTADEYELEGHKIRNPGEHEIAIHPDIPWLGATLDREEYIDWLTDEGIAPDWYPLEIKQVNDPDYFFRASEWTEDPPEQYWTQVQVQAACKKKQLGILLGQFPPVTLASTTIWYEADFFERLAYPKLDQFWNYNVRKRIPPKVPDHKGALKSVKRLHRRQNGETIALNDQAKKLCEEWCNLKWDAKENEQKIKKCEARLRSMLGTATYGAFTDGSYLERDARDILRRKR